MSFCTSAFFTQNSIDLIATLGAASSIYMCSRFCFASFLSMRGGFGHQMQEETNKLPKIGRKCILSQRQELALHPLYLLIHNVQGNEDMVMAL